MKNVQGTFIYIYEIYPCHVSLSHALTQVGSNDEDLVCDTIKTILELENKERNVNIEYKKFCIATVLQNHRRKENFLFCPN